MKRFLPVITLFGILILSGCYQSSPGAAVPPEATPILPKAVYLSAGPGVLTADDLAAHPEVIRVQTFDDFKTHAGSKIALLVDKNAVGMVDNQWLNSPPQKYYPLVVVGYNDPLYCFRDTLSVGTIQGPYMDWSKETLEPGFCVWMIQKQTSNETSAFMKGYKQKPAIQDILEVTNPLLEEK